MKWTKAKKDLSLLLKCRISRNECDEVRQLISDHPWLVMDHDYGEKSTYIALAAYEGHVDMMDLLLELGFNINALELPEENTALAIAIGFDRYEMVQYLADSILKSAG